MHFIDLPRDVLNLIINPALIGYSSVCMCQLTCKKLYLNPHRMRIDTFILLEEANNEKLYNIFRWVWDKSTFKYYTHGGVNRWSIINTAFIDKKVDFIEWALTRNLSIDKCFTIFAAINSMDPITFKRIIRLPSLSTFDLSTIILRALKANKPELIEGLVPSKSKYPIRAYFTFLLNKDKLSIEKIHTLKWLAQNINMQPHVSYIKYNPNRLVHWYVQQVLDEKVKN
jgi:hypothetical protein